MSWMINLPQRSPDLCTDEWLSRQILLNLDLIVKTWYANSHLWCGVIGWTEAALNTAQLQAQAMNVIKGSTEVCVACILILVCVEWDHLSTSWQPLSLVVWKPKMNGCCCCSLISTHLFSPFFVSLAVVLMVLCVCAYDFDCVNENTTRMLFLSSPRKSKHSQLCESFLYVVMICVPCNLNKYYMKLADIAKH